MASIRPENSLIRRRIGVFIADSFSCAWIDRISDKHVERQNGEENVDQQGNNPGMRFHAAGTPRGLGKIAQSSLSEGRFGRMFRNLPAFEPADGKLGALADTMFEPEETGNDDEESEFDNPNIVAGITYLGQFIDHDLTFDPASKLQRQNDPDALHNFRTPRFDLDSVYGRGPDDEPYLYKPDGIKLRIGKNAAG
jgi:hypothetical protein